MEDVGLPERAETNQNNPEKTIAGERIGQNTKLEASDGRYRELRSFVSGTRAKW